MASNLSSPKPASPPGHSRICDLNVEVRPVSDLDVRTQNPRTHSIKQIRSESGQLDQQGASDV